MALDPVVNFFQSEIATLPVASGGTSIVVSSGDGAKLPDPSVDGAFNLTIYEEGNPFASPEIVRVTARSSDTLTVTRAQEGTTATTKTTGTTWVVVMFPTAKTIQDIDSAKLDVAGGTMTGDLTIPDKIIHSGDTNTAIRFPANDTVSVETGGTERMRVDNTGVGIGTSTPARILHVARQLTSTSATPSASASLVLEATGANLIDFVGDDNTPNVQGLGFSDGTTLVGRVWYTHSINALTFATSSAERARIDSSGNVGIGTTSPATKLDVSGSIRTSTGILFGTDTASANTLDDYEEGTWSPTYIAVGTDFTSITYPAGTDIRYGTYVKIGNRVICTFAIATTSLAGGVGQVIMGGLPFTAASTTFNVFSGGGGVASFAVLGGDNGKFDENYPSYVGVLGNSTTCSIYYRDASDGQSLLIQADDFKKVSGTRNYMTGTIIYYL